MRIKNSCVLLCLFLFTGIGQAKIIQLSPSQDTQINEAPSQQDFILGKQLLLEINQNPNVQRILIQFDLTQLSGLTGRDINSAVIEMNLGLNDSTFSRGQGANIDIHRLTNSWEENQASWNCRLRELGDCTASWQGGNFVPSRSDRVNIRREFNGIIQFDIADDIRNILDSNDTDFGWLIKKQREDRKGILQFLSRESSSAPRLVISTDSSIDILDLATLF